MPGRGQAWLPSYVEHRGGSGMLFLSLSRERSLVVLLTVLSCWKWAACQPLTDVKGGLFSTSQARHAQCFMLKSTAHYLSTRSYTSAVAPVIFVVMLCWTSDVCQRIYALCKFLFAISFLARARVKSSETHCLADVRRLFGRPARPPVPEECH